ncbi:hypothetical protein F5051DRAFT_328367 [Lentinula edodes]|nr:hypothetical protein F5051DRAFT_328367 [Lentinula edodes]
MTTHKAQGQTMDSAIVDIESCHGTEAPYVIISRVKTLDGLLILRLFQLKKIQCRQSQDNRVEQQRLHYLSLTTIVSVGSVIERAKAKKSLRTYKGPGPTVADSDVQSLSKLEAIQ